MLPFLYPFFLCNSLFGHHDIDDSGKASLILSQCVDNSGDVYRATYTAFRCSSVSGTLGAHERVQVGALLQNWLSFIHPLVSVTGLAGPHNLPAQRRRRLRPVLGPGVPPCVRATAEKQSSLPALRHSEHSFNSPPEIPLLAFLVFLRRKRNF